MCDQHVEEKKENQMGSTFSHWFRYFSPKYFPQPCTLCVLYQLLSVADVFKKVPSATENSPAKA